MHQLKHNVSALVDLAGLVCSKAPDHLTLVLKFKGLVARDNSQTVQRYARLCSQERKLTVRQPKRRVGAKVNPTELSAEEAAVTAEIEENRVEMLQALVVRGAAGAGLLETVLNHASFAQTVENIFALSFMVRRYAC